MENKNSIAKANEELLDSIKNNKNVPLRQIHGLLRSSKIKKLETAYAREFYKAIYEIYKDVVDQKTKSKLDEIDRRINDLMGQLTTNFDWTNVEQYGLQFLGYNTFNGMWRDESDIHDGYPTKYRYGVSYYPETGFIAEDERQHGSSGDLKVTIGSKTRLIKGDERRDESATINRFLKENEEILLEIHKALLEKKEILCNVDNTELEKNKETCQKIVQLFKTSIESVKPRKREDNREEENRKKVKDVTNNKPKQSEDDSNSIVGSYEDMMLDADNQEVTNTTAKKR